MKKWSLILGAALLLFCLVTLVRERTDTTSYVTCEPSGQLGNQLFQIAATLSYAWDHKATAVFPDWNSPEYRRAYTRDRMLFRLKTSPVPGFWTRLLHLNFWHSYRSKDWDANPDPIPEQHRLKLLGYFSSWAYFHHHRQELLEVFAPSPEILSHLQSKYAELLAHPCTVAVHVRTYNAALHKDKSFAFVGLDYYKKAMEHFPQDTLFVIFSDRINWCKHHFPTLGKHCVFIEGNDMIEDLFLMSMMKHNIIANSTFSWWGAYLNQNPSRTIIAPYPWRHPDQGVFPPKTNHFFFEDWLLISPDYDAPYPQDMTWHDTRSRSIDN